MEKIKARKVSIYLREEQLEFLDKQAEKQGLSRSRFIERTCLPQELWVLEEKRGRPKARNS